VNLKINPKRSGVSEIIMHVPHSPFDNGTTEKKLGIHYTMSTYPTIVPNQTIM
jgi:polysaccharide deacetylase 2 family uncharacterized protein YibQ